MKYLSKFAVACVLAVMSKVAVAMPILTPTGLNPGDTYQLVFVTSTTRDALSTDIADYNAFVQAAADAAWGGGGSILDGVQWSAIGSTATVDARDNALVSGPVYNLADQIIADDFTDMWDGQLHAPIDVNEIGAVTSRFVYTGSSFNGYTSVDFGLGSASGSAIVGQAWGTAGNWVYSGFTYNTDFLHNVYALSPVLTMPGPSEPVPVPATLSLFGLGLAGLGISRRKRFTQR